MTTIVVTGSASGIGAATRIELEREGHRVVGVDLHDAEVTADLATPEGRDAMVAGVEQACGGMLDGLVAAAGIMGDSPKVVAVDYFGAVATLEGLRPMLARGTDASAVVLSSNSATMAPGITDELVDIVLAGDEPRALEAIASHQQTAMAYMTAKLALARWVRRHAPTDAWIGSGVRLNAIAPGVIQTPMTENDMEFIFSMPEVFPVPIGRPGRPEEIAALCAFLLSPQAGFFCGSFIVCDGGTEAAVRADDWPVAR